MSSLYSNSSEQYWQQRNKHGDGKKKKALIAVGVLGIALVGSISVIRGRLRAARARNDELEMQHRQLEITEGHRKQCEAHVKDMHNECSSLCNGERKSIPRPTMYQSCLHGCLGAFHEAAVIGCREGSEEDAFHRVGVDSFEHCSNYQNTLPRPEVLSTCRKYHREGTKAGHRSGLRYLLHLLDTDIDTLHK